MVIAEQVEPGSLGRRSVEEVLILCYHRGWDNHNDCIVHEIVSVCIRISRY